MKSVTALLLSFLLFTRASYAVTGFETENLVLYQTDSVMRARIPDVKELANYFKALEKICVDYFHDIDKQESLQIVIAVKPAKQSRVWFISSTRQNNKELETLGKQLESVPALEVFSGPVAFAIVGKIAGGDDKLSKSSSGPPIPKEWLEATKEQKSSIQMPEGFLQAVWPSPVGILMQKAVTPTEFEIQILEPIGGKISRPKGWFYTESHKGPSYTWIMSREEATKAPYTTGVRVQTIVGIKKGTGKTPKEFVLEYAASKKKEADKVLNACDEKDQGLFSRICFETEEGPHRILYSLFWGNNDLDIVVVSIAGTTKELWETYAPVFDKMSNFELIDMKRFEK